MLLHYQIFLKLQPNNGATPFIASIGFLNDLAETADLRNLLKKFILTKLEGYASEIVSAEPDSVTAIVNALKAKIRPESSKVVEGRMMARAAAVDGT